MKGNIGVNPGIRTPKLRKERNMQKNKELNVYGRKMAEFYDLFTNSGYYDYGNLDEGDEKN